ncbi:MAG: hypothetical protein M1838_001387 [Thelocarpon superellum]|nr:MAG: hypothetical protein M1838_001387 [Thelocarpon superellum]
MEFGPEESILSSSPDPLGDSLQSSRPFTPTRIVRHDSATPRPTSTGRTFQLPDFVLNTPQTQRRSQSASPSKLSATKESAISPWRFRVTVEAEREDEAEQCYDNTPGSRVRMSRSPSRSIVWPRPSTTRTMTIPVKGLESSPPQPVRRRGRPRKTDITPTKKTPSPATKNGRRRKTIGATVDAVDDDEDSDLAFDLTPRRGPGRRRRSTLIQTRKPSNIENILRGESLDRELETEFESALVVSNAATKKEKKKRSRRKAMSPVEIAEDDDADPVISSATSTRVDHESEEVNPLGELHLNRVRSFSNRSSEPPTQGPTDLDDVPKEPEVKDAGLDLRFSPAKKTPQKPRSSDDLGQRAIIDHSSSRHTYPTPDPSQGSETDQMSLYPELPSVEVEDEPSMMRLGEMDSILDSEGFSMVSMDSIPSVREHLSSPMVNQPRENHLQDTSRVSISSVDLVQDNAGPGTQQRVEAELNTPVKEASQPLDTSASCGLESMRASLIPARGGLESTTRLALTKPMANLVSAEPPRSSPPVRPLALSDYSQMSHQQTPSITFSSPSLPPPLPVAQAARRPSLAPSSDRSHAQGAKEKTPKLSRVVGAGIALQSVLGTKARLGSPFTSPARVQQTPPKPMAAMIGNWFLGSKSDHNLDSKSESDHGKGKAVEEDVRVSMVSGPTNDDVFTPDESPAITITKVPRCESRAEYALRMPCSKSKDPDMSIDGVSVMPSRKEELKLDPVLEDGDEMSWRYDTPVKKLNSSTIVAKDATVVKRQDEKTLQNPSRHEGLNPREAQWQKEREAVSHQIDHAKPGEVIVIDDTTVSSGNESTSVDLSELQLQGDSLRVSEDIWQMQMAAYPSGFEDEDETPSNPDHFLPAVSREKVATGVTNEVGQENELQVHSEVTVEVRSEHRSEVRSEVRPETKTDSKEDKPETEEHVQPAKGRSGYELKSIFNIRSFWSSKSDLQEKSHMSPQRTVKEDEQDEQDEQDEPKEDEDEEGERGEDSEDSNTVSWDSHLSLEEASSPAAETLKVPSPPTAARSSPEAPKHLSPQPIDLSATSSPKPITPSVTSSPSIATTSTSSPCPMPDRSVCQSLKTTGDKWQKTHWRALQSLVLATPSSTFSPLLRYPNPPPPLPWFSPSDLAHTTPPLVNASADLLNLLNRSLRGGSGDSGNSDKGGAAGGGGRKCIILGPTELSLISQFQERVRCDNEGRDAWDAFYVARRLVALLIGAERRTRPHD